MLVNKFWMKKYLQVEKALKSNPSVDSKTAEDMLYLEEIACMSQLANEMAINNLTEPFDCNAVAERKVEKILLCNDTLYMVFDKYYLLVKCDSIMSGMEKFRDVGEGRKEAPGGMMHSMEMYYSPGLKMFDIHFLLATPNYWKLQNMWYLEISGTEPVFVPIKDKTPFPTGESQAHAEAEKVMVRV